MEQRREDARGLQSTEGGARTGLLLFPPMDHSHWADRMHRPATKPVYSQMLRQGFGVYQRDTARFDQPYVTGDCGGEGESL